MPLAIPAAAGLIALLVFILAVALAIMWTQILRGPLIHMAGVAILHIHPFGFLNTVVKSVDNWLDAAVKGTERAMVWPLHAAMSVFATSAEATADLAQATWQALEYWKHHMPRHVGAQTGQSISPRIKQLEREYKGIDARVDTLEGWKAKQGSVGAAKSTPVGTNISGRVKTLEKEYVGIDARLDKLAKGKTASGAKVKTGTRAIPQTKPRAVPRAQAPARHWTDVFTKTAAAGAFLYALSRFGLGWLRCPGVTRFGKKFGCGIGRFLDALFGLALEGLVITHLCQLTKTLTRIGVEVQPYIVKLTTGVADLMRCQGAGALPPLPLDDFTLPPIQGNGLAL